MNSNTKKRKGPRGSVSTVQAKPAGTWLANGVQHNLPDESDSQSGDWIWDAKL